MARQTTNLNAKYKLNVRMVCDRMEVLGIPDCPTLAERMGCHKATASKLLLERRVPNPELFKRMQEVLQVPEQALLLPLVGEAVKCG